MSLPAEITAIRAPAAVAERVNLGEGQWPAPSPSHDPPANSSKMGTAVQHGHCALELAGAAATNYKGHYGVASKRIHPDLTETITNSRGDGNCPQASRHGVRVRLSWAKARGRIPTPAYLPSVAMGEAACGYPQQLRSSDAQHADSPPHCDIAAYFRPVGAYLATGIRMSACRNAARACAFLYLEQLAMRHAAARQARHGKRTEWITNPTFRCSALQAHIYICMALCHWT